MIKLKIFGVFSSLLILGLSPVCAQDYDLVILEGRVMDPETRFDAVRNVGIKDGRIATITEKEISGRETINVHGHVVAPGFIDFHSHSQDPFGFKLYVRDGVTTPLDLEAGAFPVNDYYDFWEKTGAIANYGTNVGYAFARIAVLDKKNPKGRAIYSDAIGAAMNDGAQFKSKVYDPLDQPALMKAVEEGLQQGAASG